MKYRNSSIIILITTFLMCLISCGDEPGTGEYQDIENQVFKLVNEHRQQNGLSDLLWSDVIGDQARTHSNNMAEGVVDFGHDGFQERVDNIRVEMSVSSAGENVAYNMNISEPAQAAVDAWLGSSGHRANIEGDYTHTGVGVAMTSDNVYYFTQIFIQSQ